jgi:hypothetical protein
MIADVRHPGHRHVAPNDGTLAQRGLIQSDQSVQFDFERAQAPCTVGGGSFHLAGRICRLAPVDRGRHFRADCQKNVPASSLGFAHEQRLLAESS